MWGFECVGFSVNMNELGLVGWIGVDGRGCVEVAVNRDFSCSYNFEFKGEIKNRFWEYIFE